ncbi:MAG: 4Fe-4S binding protein [Syntrophales bacterium]|nr:4Fe-4S binding protein [Syntrophales bacterium]
MGRENDSGGRISKPLRSCTSGPVDDPAAAEMSDSSGGRSINFFSGEFNFTDDLNDCSGNYGSFQSLDGVVTAHMRHRTERRDHGRKIDAFASDETPAIQKDKEATAAPAPVAATSLSIISEGRTLIIDADAERAMACGKLLADRRLTCTLLVTKNPSSAPFPSRMGQPPLHYMDTVSVHGAFGGFSATAAIDGAQKPLAQWLGSDTAVFDLVLDLQPVPSYVGSRLPLGYYAPGSNPASLEEALAEMPEMRGQFQKPQFTILLKDRCLHGRSRTRDCRRCLSACPFGAIESLGSEISVNHYRCQGCGACALSCHAAALRMVRPPLEALPALLWRKLKEYRAEAGSLTILVISEGEDAGIPEAHPSDAADDRRRIHLEVEQIGHVGPEILLMALAWGVEEIVVVCGVKTPPAIRDLVERQVRMVEAIREGLGGGRGSVSIADAPPDGGNEKTEGRDNTSPEPAGLPAPFSAGQERRTMARLAVQLLHDQTGVRETWIPLHTDSPFGAVAIDTNACTLCMACAVACPSGALTAGGDMPRLMFRESRCHQCGLCEETCPESALRRRPRMLCSMAEAESAVVLAEAEPARCVECGRPFASPAMIRRMQEKLTGHWMYGSERQRRRLQMCGPCRTRDALMSHDFVSRSQL